MEESCGLTSSRLHNGSGHFQCAEPWNVAVSYAGTPTCKSHPWGFNTYRVLFLGLVTKLENISNNELLKSQCARFFLQCSVKQNSFSGFVSFFKYFKIKPMCLISLPVSNSWHGHLEKKNSDSNLLSLKAQKRSSQQNSVLSHISICLV